MSIVSGTAPWYERYGMTKLTDSSKRNGLWDTMIIPSFEIVCSSYRSRYIRFTGSSNGFSIRIILSGTPRFSENVTGNSAEYVLDISDIIPTDVYVYYERSAVRFLVEQVTSSNVEKCEIILFSTGSKIQIHSSKSISYRFEDTFDAGHDIVSGRMSSNNSSIVFTYSGTTGTLSPNSHEDSGVTTASKILDTINVRVGDTIRRINVYSLNISGDSNSKKLRIMTPNGIGYIRYKKQTSDEDLTINIGGNKCSLVEYTAASVSGYEYKSMIYTEETLTNVKIPSSSSTYWLESTKYNFSETVSAHNILFYGLSSKMSKSSPTTVYDSVVSSAVYMKYWYNTSSNSGYNSLGNSSGPIVNTFWSLTTPDTPLSLAISNLTGVSLDVSSGNSSYYHYPRNASAIFVMVKTGIIIN